MKIKVLSIILLFVVMAFLPFVATNCEKKSQQTLSSTQDYAIKADENYKKSNDKASVLSGLVFALCDEKSCDEYIKAVTILMNTNYTSKPDDFDLSNEDIYISEDKINNSDLELYNKINNIVNSNIEFYLRYNDKIVYIPYSKCSNGHTVYDEQYPYLSAVGSPWDCFSENCKEDDVSGVSLDGIKYLCSEGESAEKALLWYLKDFEIK